MNLGKSKFANENYLSKVVQIDEFRNHSDETVTRLKCTSVDGYNIVVGIDSKPGLYIYFPTMSKINGQFLSYANLYRDVGLNSQPEKTGFFESNGRVRAIKLRKELSEGFLIEAVIFENWVTSITNKSIDNLQAGVEFDCIQDEGKEFWVSKKYIIKSPTIRTHRVKVPKRLSKVVDNQFRFHYETILLKKVPFILNPESYIQMSYKIHGTSGISAYVLCKKPLKWYQKPIQFITKKQIPNLVYDYIYASRTVIKNPEYNPYVKQGYYDCDVWGEADKIVRPCLSKGLTAYYEIVGFLPNGKYIQKKYDYGCIQPVEGKPYEHEVNFKVRIYRVTYTNVDGEVFEFTTKQVQQWCSKVGLTPVEQCYYGLAGDLYPDINKQEHWNEEFINRLSNDKDFYMELDSPHCRNKVPHEGLVIKLSDKPGMALKLKAFRFINKEQELLDKGETNIEDDE